MSRPSENVSPVAWDHSDPFVIEVEVTADDLDHLNHANNAAYLRWMERAAWAHSASIGLDWPAYRRLAVACVVHRHELDYLAATHAGDRLAVATWVKSNDGRISMWRGFQIVRYGDAKTVMRAASRYVCARLDDGSPCRMPPEFREGYAVIGHER